MSLIYSTHKLNEFVLNKLTPKNLNIIHYMNNIYIPYLVTSCNNQYIKLRYNNKSKNPIFRVTSFCPQGIRFSYNQNHQQNDAQFLDWKFVDFEKCSIDVLLPDNIKKDDLIVYKL